MAEIEEQIHAFFASNHIKLKRKWLKEVLFFLSQNKTIKVRTRAELINLIYHQWLFFDFEQSTEANCDKATNFKQLQQPCVFQIQSIADIGTPKLKQYKQLTDPTYDESKAELGVDFDNLNPNKGYKCFCIQISDGVNQFKAFEKKRIPELKQSTCPGSKVLIFSGTTIQQGVFFLTPENCQIFGGAVEGLLRENNFLKQIAEQLDRPLPTKATSNGHNSLPLVASKPSIEQQIKLTAKQPQIPAPPVPVRQQVNQPRRSAAPMPASQPIYPPLPDRKPDNLPDNSNFHRSIPTTASSQIQKPSSSSSSLMPPTNKFNPSLVSHSQHTIQTGPPQQILPVQQTTTIHIDPKIMQMYKAMNIQTLAEIKKKIAFSIGCKHFSVIAIVYDISSPFRIVENTWTMSVVLVDDSQTAVECNLSHELLLDLIGMTPEDAIAVKSCGSAERKRRGAERIELMQEQLARLDLVFDIEVMFKQRPIIQRVQTMADRLNIV